ncbi:MAG: glycosyltransferase [Anaerolineales bacterium]|nr:glycosyltransferase [Anaerolineales bacterium]
MLRVILEADLVTTTTPALQRIVQHLNPNTCLLPNYLDNQLWQPRPAPVRRADKIVIGYMGSNSHAADLEMIAPALLRLAGRFPKQVEYTFWGARPPSLLVGCPAPVNWAPLENYDYPAFAAEFSQQQADIFIAPLTDTQFNHCKSPIKFLEYSVLGVPGVYSRSEAYASIVQPAENGLLAGSLEEWEACLARLTEDPEYAARLGRQAQQTAWQDWRISDHASQWAQAYAAIGAGLPHQPPARLKSLHRTAIDPALLHMKPVEGPVDANLKDTKPVVKQASLILVAYNNLELTRQCLESILAHTQDIDYELILVDNASSDGTARYLTEFAGAYPDVQAILNESNLGFARAINQGVAASSGDGLVFLNNDILVTPGWLAGLIGPLADPTIGLVGPVTNQIGNQAKIPVTYENLEQMPGFAERYTAAHRGNLLELEMLALFCAAMRRSVYQEIGPLDEQFEIGMFEDDDYALRLHAAGYRLVCTEAVFIHHHGSAGFFSLPEGQYWEIFAKNMQRFEEKWQLRWLPQPQRAELIREQLRLGVENQLQLATLLGSRAQQLAEREQTIIELEQENARLRTLLNDTFTSQGWKLLAGLRRLRSRLFPTGSQRDRLLRGSGRLLRRLGRPFERAIAASGWVSADEEKHARALAKILARQSDLKGSIIFIPSIPWDVPLFQRPHQLAASLARQQYQVLFCETIYGAPTEIQLVAPNLYRLTNIDLELFKEFPGLIVFCLAYNSHFLACFTKPYTVYEYIDELQVFPGSQKDLQRSHTRMLETADLIIATSDALFEKIHLHRPDALLVPNAADIEFFETKITQTLKPPAELRRLLQQRKPVIGYYGALATWFDYDLVQQAAAARPQYQFLLIGPDYDSSVQNSALKEIPNLTWLGVKPYHQLPEYLKYFDVAMIPFKNNEITQATSPLKLFEYLAGAKPVVSTAIHECQKYPVVLIAQDCNEFVQKLDQALALRNDAAYLEQLRQTALQNTWDLRASQITEHLSQTLAGPAVNSTHHG